MNEIFLQALQPEAHDLPGFLLWTVGILVTAIVSIFGLYVNALKQVKGAHELRIKDRDDLIDDLKKDIENLRREKDEILNQIKPSLEAANTIASNVLQLLRTNEK